MRTLGRVDAIWVVRVVVRVALRMYLRVGHWLPICHGRNGHDFVLRKPECRVRASLGRPLIERARQARARAGAVRVHRSGRARAIPGLVWTLVVV